MQTSIFDNGSPPRSTPNYFVFLELGILPVEFEIGLRQLNYLHHILNLDKNDPVKKVYIESRKCSHEKNWANSIHDTLLEYHINLCDEEINTLSKTKWKKLVKGKVTDKAFSIFITSSCSTNFSCPIENSPL